MRDVSLARSQIQDPVGKRYWPFNKGRDGCRAPMQWSAKPNAGFTNGEPWLPLNKDYPVRNVESQSASPASMLAFYKSLIQLRRAHPALNAGNLEMVQVENEDLLVYQRQAGDEKMMIVLNFSKQIHTYQLPTQDFNKWELLYVGNEAMVAQMTENNLNLPGYGFGILISRSE